MNYILNRIGVALLLVVFASASTFAKVHKGTITLNWDTKVGEVLVKKGTYHVKFDDETSELSILNGRKSLPNRSPNSNHGRANFEALSTL